MSGRRITAALGVLSLVVMGSTALHAVLHDAPGGGPAVARANAREAGRHEPAAQSAMWNRGLARDEQRSVLSVVLPLTFASAPESGPKAIDRYCLLSARSAVLVRGYTLDAADEAGDGLAVFGRAPAEIQGTVNLLPMPWSGEVYAVAGPCPAGPMLEELQRGLLDR